VVLVGASAWLGKLWLERILERERHERQQELERLRTDQQLAVSSQLERLRAELSLQQATVAVSMAAASAAAGLGHKERLKAVDQMWRASRCQRNAAVSAITYWDLIYSFEKGQALTAKGKAHYRDLLKVEDLAERCKSQDDETEALRPFLGEELWSLYYGYRMLVGRASIPLAIALSKNEDPADFFADKDIQRLLQRILTPAEQQEYSASRSDRLQWLLSRFEAKIMAAAEQVLASARARLLCLEPTWKKIRKLRHKLFAHRDRYLDYEAVLAEVSITYNEFQDLIDQFFELLNEVLYYRQRTTWPRDKATVRDTHKMLQALRSPQRL